MSANVGKTINRKWMCNATKCVQIEWRDGKGDDGCYSVRRAHTWNNSEDFVAHESWLYGVAWLLWLKCIWGNNTITVWMLLPFAREISVRPPLDTDRVIQLWLSRFCVDVCVCVRGQFKRWTMPGNLLLVLLFKWRMFHVNHFHWMNFNKCASWERFCFHCDFWCRMLMRCALMVILTFCGTNMDICVLFAIK